jgi:hypothetical protein
MLNEALAYVFEAESWSQLSITSECRRDEMSSDAYASGGQF